MSRRGENIYKRRDGRWEGRYIAEYDVNGKAKYRAVYAHSYNDVKQKLLNAKTNNTTGRVSLSAATSVKEWFAQWLNELKNSIKESTYVIYKRYMDKVIFNGSGLQTISFDSTNSGFKNLSIQNGTGMIIVNTPTKVSNTLTQPGGAEIQGRDNVTLQGKSAFEDHGELNVTINRHVGNAENVIPTWLDYEAYLNDEPVTPTTPPTTEPVKPTVDWGAYVINNLSIDKSTATANVTKTTEGNGTMVVASYSDNGMLIGIAVKDISMSKDETRDIAVPIDTNGAEYVYAFIWDNIKTMKPLCEKKHTTV